MDDRIHYDVYWSHFPTTNHNQLRLFSSRHCDSTKGDWVTASTGRAKRAGIWTRQRLWERGRSRSWITLKLFLGEGSILAFLRREPSCAECPGSSYSMSESSITIWVDSPVMVLGKQKLENQNPQRKNCLKNRARWIQKLITVKLFLDSLVSWVLC